MTFLSENPFAIGIAGAILVAVSLTLLLQTTRAAFLYVAIAIGALTAGLLVVERRIITPREEVALTLHAIAREIEANDVDAVLSHVSTSAPSIRRKGESALSSFAVERVKIKPNLTIELGHDGTATANAKFNVVIIGGDRKQVIKNQRAARYFIVNFQNEAGEWKIVDFEHFDPRKGM